MRTRTRLLLSALVAALALSAAISTAQARRFEFSNQSFRVVWPSTSKLTFTNVSGSISLACQVTLEGSFHSRTLSKVCGQLIGYVTFARVTRPCEGGNAWMLDGAERVGNTLPWHLRYEKFNGFLPRITSIRIQLIGVSFLLEISNVNCLYLSSATSPAYGFIDIDAEGVANTFTAETGALIPIHARLEPFPLLCPETVFLRGTGNLRLQGSTTTRITVRLVQ
jgi:hypothetical protein